MTCNTLTTNNNKKMNMSPLMERIHLFIQKHALITPHTTIIIGLSGGPDSVFLLHVLAHLAPTYHLTLIAAHLNHEWRDNAWQDVELCKKATQQLGIPLMVKKRTELANFSHKYNGSKEEEARHMRRFFFEHIATEHNAQRIALGHHAQDQQETFFIRLLRGSSLTGLTAMRSKNGLYIRPLLETNKSDILAYLHDNQIAYASDYTNDSDAFLRNRIRQTVVPALAQCDSRFDTNFVKTITRLQESEETLAALTQETFNRISLYEENILWIDINQLLDAPIHLQDRLILHWLITSGVSFPVSHTFLQEIKRFLKTNSHTQTHTICPGLRLLKKHHQATIKT